MFKINMFQSGYGDCLLVQLRAMSGLENNLLIDCGFYYKDIIKKVKSLLGPQGKLDRVIITHYDADHIQGAISLIKENGSSDSPKNVEIEQVWLNSFRHLQFFEKDDSQIDRVISRKVKAYSASKIQQNPVIESPISASQASTLGCEVFKGGYQWNLDANGKAICVENLDSLNISSEVKLRLLSPNKDKLKDLEKSFIKDLRKKGLKPQEGEIFDDAFELYIQSVENLSRDIEGPISAKSYQVNSKTIKAMSLGESYSADNAVGNGSSIAFVLEFDNKKVLFLGDAHGEVVVESLKSIYGSEAPIFFDAIKVSHHGSFNNNGPELYKLIDSNKFLFSTNGKHPSHKHPDHSTISCIINRPLKTGKGCRELIFNYELEHLNGFRCEELQREFNYKLICSEEVLV